VNKPLRVLFVTGPYPPAVSSGGPAESVSGLAEALVQRGHEVWVAASRLDAGRALEVTAGKTVERNGVQVSYFDPVGPMGRTVSDWGAFSLGPSFRSWLPDRLKNTDWVDLQLGLMLDAPLIRSQCRLYRIPFGYHQRGNLDPRRFLRGDWKKRWYIQLREKGVLRDAAVLIALSAREEEVYRRWSPKAVVKRVPNGVDVQGWRAPAVASLGLQKQLPQDLKTPLLLWMSRWDTRKGWEIALRAMAAVTRQHPETKGLMVGPGLEAVRSQAANILNKLDAGDRVGIRAEVNGEDRRALLQRSNLFLLPTQGEGFSMGILEAMACGCVVVTTPEANIPELVTHKAGILTSRDVGAFEREICSLLETPEAIAHFGNSASSLVADLYDWTRVAAQYEQIVEESLSS